MKTETLCPQQWQPAASIDTLRALADINHRLRQFFYQRNILEVSTPLLAQHTVTDIHIESLPVTTSGDEQTQLGFLQTSPEYMMKRLLAAGSGPIYQMSKAFRQEESGRHHRPEFSLLEWYRPGFDMFALIDEVDLLLRTIAKTTPSRRISYQDVFQHYLQINPHTASVGQLTRLAHKQNLSSIVKIAAGDKDTLLELLLSEAIEPKLHRETSASQPIILYDYPASQAALAKLKPSATDPSTHVAARFEVYWQGVELANGFDELTCADEQRQRFLQQQSSRRLHKKSVPAVDELFLAALEHGLPDCSGVALGMDRLYMLILNAVDIEKVNAF